MCNSTPALTPNTENMMLALAASHCCICGKGLRDAESTQLGIGPECSGKHYDPSHTPSEEDVMEALGLLHLGMTEGHFSVDLINELRSLKGNARKFSNRLVLHTALNYSERDVVLACAGVIRALGYGVMADRLEINRVKARITEAGDDLHVLMNRSKDIDRDMAKIPGAANNRPKEGHKVGWTVPKAQRDHFMCLLGVHFYSHFVMVEDGSLTLIRKRSKYELYRFQRPPRPASPAPAAAPAAPAARSGVLSALTPDGPVEIDVGPRDLQVRTPYNGPFKEALKSDIPYRDRSWQGCWVVKTAHLDRVKALIDTHFGVTVS